MNRRIYGALWTSLIVANFMAAARAQGPVPDRTEPTWPVAFDLLGSQVGMYRFALTQPGIVLVDVRTTGAPISVRLEGPMPQSIEQQGVGAVRVSYQATVQDVQRGVFWGVAVQLLPQAAAQAAPVTGTIRVQHPAADPAIVQQAIAGLRARRAPIPSEQEIAQRAAQHRAERIAMHQQRMTAAENELTQRRVAILKQLQPQVDAMRQQSSAAVASPPSAAGLRTRALAPLTVFPSVPTINSCSAREGVPGDPIMIAGTGFGSAGGEVHFVIGPDFKTQDIVASNTIWTTGGVLASVPDPSGTDPSVGALPYPGQIYLVVHGVKSNLVPFKFDPIIDHRTIRI